MSKLFKYYLGAALVKRRSHRCIYDKVKTAFGPPFLQCRICRQTKRGGRR